MCILNDLLIYKMHLFVYLFLSQLIESFEIKFWHEESNKKKGICNQSLYVFWVIGAVFYAFFVFNSLQWMEVCKGFEPHYVYSVHKPAVNLFNGSLN